MLQPMELEFRWKFEMEPTKVSLEDLGASVDLLRSDKNRMI